MDTIGIDLHKRELVARMWKLLTILNVMVRTAQPWTVQPTAEALTTA